MEAFLAAQAADRLPPDLRGARQRELLSKLLRHARETVPLFRDRAPAAAMDDRNARETLAEWPVMRREFIQHDLQQFMSSLAGATRDDATGGSTGTPMVFRVDRATQIAREASLMWANSLTGWERGERIAMLWGSDRDVRSAVGALRFALRWRLENMRWFDAFDMGNAEMARFHRELEAFRPHLLVAYAGSAFDFARYLEGHGHRPAYPLRGLVSSAEVLSPVMRATVEGVFGKPVFDRYGNREAGAIAAECHAHEGLHIHECDFIVEIDSPDPGRIPGPILVTYLRNIAMPLIRYDTGDLGCFASRASCRCGRTTARLAPVVGRASDAIVTASGTRIHGEFFTHVLYAASGVHAFQFVQETRARYRLLLVARGEAVREMETEWRTAILDALGPGSLLDVEYVEKIPLLPSGKRKFTVSHLAGAT